MKKLIIISLLFTACNKYIETRPLYPHVAGTPPAPTAAPININIEINNDNSSEVNIDQDFDFNIHLYGDVDYFAQAAPYLPNPPVCKDPHPKKHFICHVYDFSGRTKLLTDLATAPHLGSFYMDTFDVTARDWQQGFPKFPANLSHLRENYAVRCFTTLKIPHSGLHTFSITSDDGMRILLSNSPILQDDGLHAPRTTTAVVSLSSGTYPLEVQWFQGPRTQIAAELKWQTPNNSTLRYLTHNDIKKTVCSQ
jgi:hypothetical protein